MKYCSKCGYPCQDDDKFCTKCGAELHQLVVNPEPAPQVAVQPVQPQVSYQTYQPAPQIQQKEKPSQTPAILSLVFGILACVAFLITVFTSWGVGVFALGFAIPALILGVKSRKDGKGLAGMIMAIIVLGLIVISLIVVLFLLIITVGLVWPLYLF